MATSVTDVGWRARRAARPWSGAPGLKLLGIAVADSAAIAVGASVLGTWGALALHALVASGFVVWSRAACRDLTVCAVVLSFAGPLAAISWWVATTVAASSSAPKRAEWYDVIALDRDTDDDASQLHEAITAGRIAGAHRRGERSFPDVLAHGTLAEKQALLGLIGLRYHPRYHPLLQAALRSPEPSVRAQAAAVSVKLKDKFRERLTAALAGVDAMEADDLAQARTSDILASSSSGFIDPPQARAALSSAVAYCELRLDGAFKEQWLVLLIRCLAALERHQEIVARLSPLGSDVPAELRPMYDASRHALARSRPEHHGGGVLC